MKKIIAALAACASLLPFAAQAQMSAPGHVIGNSEQQVTVTFIDHKPGDIVFVSANQDDLVFISEVDCRTGQFRLAGVMTADFNIEHYPQGRAWKVAQPNSMSEAVNAYACSH